MPTEIQSVNSLPLISIVTPSYNQAQFLGETLQSLLDQDYPNLEVIIQDGGSTDGSVAVAESFVAKNPEMFRLFVEKDRGQAHAINLGFAKACGEIFGILNSDDTLYLGTLLSVAREIDPVADRFVVFGRCLFTGEDSPYVGVEHPAAFKSRFDHLAIWERGVNTIPQPAVFWHRRVWELCGGVNESETHVLDYDLFCKFSERFNFHRVDELWATYRMHSFSKSAQRTESEVLAMSIAASRRNWPPLWHPLRWRLAFSFWLYELHAHERARHRARQAERALSEGRVWKAIAPIAQTLFFSPSMAWRRLLQPVATKWGLDGLEKLVWSNKTRAEDFTGRYPDGWLGPLFQESIPVPSAANTVRLSLEHSSPVKRSRSLTVELRLNGQKRERKTIRQLGSFQIEANLESFRGQNCLLELRTRPHFVPSDTVGEDHRSLAVRLVALEIV